MSTPSVTVVVTTCAMPDRAIRAVASVLACEQPPLEVIVVENRPQGSDTARRLRERFGEEGHVRCGSEPCEGRISEPPVLCVAESRRGLSRARNCGLAAARGEVVAFTDDDVVVERGWVGAIAAAFARSPRAACVTGPIAALALDTPGQRLFERFARLGKGAQRRAWAIDRPPVGDPLFPYAAGRFGSGANIALRAGFARAIGGFDVRLGAGTPARGGEDLELFIRVLRCGAEILYEPGAALRHEHPRSWHALRRHAFDYGVGLSAMLAEQLLRGTERRALLGRIPAGIRYLRDPASRKNAAKDPDYPRRLDVLERLGMAYGPLAYLASALIARASAGGRR